MGQNSSIHGSPTTNLRGLSWLWIFWDVSIEQILYSSVRIVPGCSESLYNLVSGESHGHKFSNDCFAGLVLGGFRLGLLLGFGFGFFLLFGRFRFGLFLLGGLLFFLLFLLGLRFLEIREESTLTVVMTTRKSPSLTPSLSS